MEDRVITSSRIEPHALFLEVMKKNSRSMENSKTLRQYREDLHHNNVKESSLRRTYTTEMRHKATIREKRRIRSLANAFSELDKLSPNPTSEKRSHFKVLLDTEAYIRALEVEVGAIREESLDSVWPIPGQDGNNHDSVEMEEVQKGDAGEVLLKSGIKFEEKGFSNDKLREHEAVKNETVDNDQTYSGPQRENNLDDFIPLAKTKMLNSMAAEKLNIIACQNRFGSNYGVRRGRGIKVEHESAENDRFPLRYLLHEKAYQHGSLSDLLTDSAEPRRGTCMDILKSYANGRRLSASYDTDDSLFSDARIDDTRYEVTSIPFPFTETKFIKGEDEPAEKEASITKLTESSSVSELDYINLSDDSF